MRINHNIAALNTYRQFNNANNAQSKSMEKLSSGLRINSAADDAAGLAISEKMRGQIRGLDMASKNAQDGISLIQTAEGALNETHDILQRMNELTTQAANDTLQSEDRTAIADELTELNSEINRIASSTQFNGKTLLNGSLGVQIDASSGLAAGSDGITAIDVAGADPSETYTIAEGTVGGPGTIELSDTAGNKQEITFADNTAGVLNFDKLGIKITVDNTFTVAGAAAAGTLETTNDAAVDIQIGANTSDGERLSLSISKMDNTETGLNTASIDVSSASNARAAMDTIKTAISKVSSERSKLGANQNRLEHTINNLSTSSENITAAESRIRDVDYALAA
ncbi:flagellin [Priestia aryabhattai]|uniref:flagellin N-terminal helical domain-containing protein n=1 Tax=Priestia aryabhattai TaxID=412384 RepID=UPI00211B8059|nr:flagellin [Priestia aryabhattai]MCQ9281101.1 flagellin [Priestia aryabhattai]